MLKFDVHKEGWCALDDDFYLNQEVGRRCHARLQLPFIDHQNISEHTGRPFKHTWTQKALWTMLRVYIKFCLWGQMLELFVVAELWLLSWLSFNAVSDGMLFVRTLSHITQARSSTSVTSLSLLSSLAWLTLVSRAPSFFPIETGRLERQAKLYPQTT